jgi:hypothetical protein
MVALFLGAVLTCVTALSVNNYSKMKRHLTFIYQDIRASSPEGGSQKMLTPISGGLRSTITANRRLMIGG